MTVQAIDGLLRPFGDAGVFEAADVHVAQRLTALAGEPDERVALAIALVVRALRGGSVCVDLRAVAAQLGMAELPWPGADDWLTAVRASPLLGSPPALRLFGDLLYLDRYWLEEEQVCADLLALSVAGSVGGVPALERLFPSPRYDEQRTAGELRIIIAEASDADDRQVGGKRQREEVVELWPIKDAVKEQPDQPG